jgi:hypothetical protein
MTIESAAPVTHYFNCWAGVYRSARRSSHYDHRTVAAARRLLTSERRGFLLRLAWQLGSRAKATRRPAMAFWFDRYGRIGNAQIVAHLEPEVFEPDRPLILRVAVNCYYGVPMTRRLAMRLGCPRDHVPLMANCSPRFELSTVPEELGDFAPWVASVVEHGETGAPINEPPHALHGWSPAAGEMPEDLWTERAWQEVEEHRKDTAVRRAIHPEELKVFER